MSVATRFKFHQPFPFCPSEISSVVNASSSFIANLSLTDVMAFAWNFETFTLTATGTSTVGARVNNADMDFTLSPISSTQFVEASLEDGSLWFGDAFGDTAFGSWPDIKQPNERVCNPTQTVNGCLFESNGTSGPLPDTFRKNFELGFWIGTDPINAGKYRLYYRLNLSAFDSIDGATDMIWDNNSSHTGYSPVSSGTISLGGQTMNWYSFVATGATPTGGGLTASSTSFTYP